MRKSPRLGSEIYPRAPSQWQNGRMSASEPARNTELTKLSARAMAQLVASRKISASELLEAHLERIQQENPRLNAFVHVDEAGARAAARRADENTAAGESLGPLHGVPIPIKSSIDVAGFPCETGTKLRAGNIAKHDAPL